MLALLKMPVQYGGVPWGQRSFYPDSDELTSSVSFSPQVQRGRRARNQTGKRPRLPAPVQQPASADQRHPSRHYRPLENIGAAAIRRRAERLRF